MASATLQPPTPLPTATSPIPAAGTPEPCPPLLAANESITPFSVGTASPEVVAPPFLYIRQNELLEYSGERAPRLVGDLSELGATSDAILLGNLAVVLREQGLQRMNLADGSNDLVVHFDPPARFGQLMPLKDGRVIYELVVDDPRSAVGWKTVVGALDPQSGSGKIVLSFEQAVTLLGPTAEGSGLYLIPRGQMPYFRHVLEVSLATGETTADLPISGDPGAVLSPDSHFILAVETPQGGLYVHDLTSGPPSGGWVPMRNWPIQIGQLLWTTDGNAYFCLLAGDYHDFDPSNLPDSYGVWRLDPRTQQLCQVTQGVRRERQLLAVSSHGNVLVTGDLQGTVLVWDLDAGRVTAEIEAPIGELDAYGLDPTGEWLLLRDSTQSVAILVDLLKGTGHPISLPSGATFVGWPTAGHE